MLTLWNGNKGGCCSEKPSQALQSSGFSEAAPHRSSCAPGTGESGTDGGLGLFPKLQDTVSILTLEADAGEWGGGGEEAHRFGCIRCPPTSSPRKHPFFPLTCPERGASEVRSPLRALTAGAVGASGASGDERRRRWRGRGRQQESRQPPAAAVSLPIPAALGQRTGRGRRGRMSQARGRAARGAGPSRGAGPCRGAEASLLPYSRTGREAACGNRARLCPCAPRVEGPRVEGPPAAAIRRTESARSCPRTGDRDSQLGRRQRRQVKQKGSGYWKGKSFLLRSRWSPTKPHALNAEEAGWGAGCGGEAGFQERHRTTATPA